MKTAAALPIRLTWYQLCQTFFVINATLFMVLHQSANFGQHHK